MSGVLDQIYNRLCLWKIIYLLTFGYLSHLILKSCRIPIGYIVNWDVLECGKFAIGYIVNWGVLEHGKLTG